MSPRDPSISLGGTRAEIIHADCLEAMAEMAAESVDAVISDPPYGLGAGPTKYLGDPSASAGFMGARWDHGVPGPEFWREALRVAKPGAHLVAFGGTRTFHRLAAAIEDSGWELRDTIATWLTGQGFPKSLNVAKALDKAAGLDPVVIGPHPTNHCPGGQWCTCDTDGRSFGATKHAPATEPASDLARKWDGWGTALRPSWEPIILARKPLIGTVAQNITRHGTGAINVDACRIPIAPGDSWDVPQPNTAAQRPVSTGPQESLDTYRDPEGTRSTPHEGGRWPANVALDEETAALLDAQTGKRGGGYGKRGSSKRARAGYTSSDSADGASPMSRLGLTGELVGYGDSGGPSRFLYVAKASKGERTHRGRVDNKHATVKPIALMRWLVRMVTPPGGLILDPFCGSGSTGVAASLEGFGFIGIEKDADSVAVARERLRLTREGL